MTAEAWLVCARACGASRIGDAKGGRVGKIARSDARGHGARTILPTRRDRATPLWPPHGGSCRFATLPTIRISVVPAEGPAFRSYCLSAGQCHRR
jgi:hypothetical protein